MIRPFQNLKAPLAAAGLASTKYVERRLQKVLGKLHFTGGGGVKISESAEGQVHIDTSSSGGYEHPFQVISASTTSILVRPGWVITRIYGTLEGLPQTVRFRVRPVPGAAGYATLNGINNGYVCLRTRWAADTGDALSYLTWSLVTVGSPVEQHLIRSTSEGGGQNGLIDIPVAKIKSGALEAQLWHSNMLLQSRLNTVYLSAT